ncbi:hypothetical protein DPMN_179435 [Dreissena polymorpha]|uniref:Uncharacterized protein n=1 Tax=Dreissena polymorpha TaxID=45954 RepID=A0A9D4ECD1_DREPO|nr:hypothetical protein DPMN_179435 [Dreissena polymorpha]
MGKLSALADDTHINDSEIARRFDDIKAQLDDMHMFMNASDASHAAKMSLGSSGNIKSIIFIVAKKLGEHWQINHKKELYLKLSAHDSSLWYCVWTFPRVCRATMDGTRPWSLLMISFPLSHFL